MAGQAKTVSGNVTTYVITDTQGSTVTVAVTTSVGAGTTCTFSSSGNVHQDGHALLANLMQIIAAGQLM